MRTLSYNLEKHKASGELVELAEKLDLDFLCLQEADTLALPDEQGPMHLAEATQRNRLGLAIYHRKDRFEAQASQAFALKKSLHDRVARPAAERLLASRMLDTESGREFIVASFHAAPLTALNSLRRAQIAAAHAQIEELGPELPHLMVGDYNYPIFKNSLSNRIAKSGYDLSLSDSLTYTRYKFFRGHFDFATSARLSIDSVTTLPQGASDHMAILVTSKLPESDEQHVIRAARPQPRGRANGWFRSAR